MPGGGLQNMMGGIEPMQVSLVLVLVLVRVLVMVLVLV